MSDVKIPTLSRNSRESETRAKDARRKPWAPLLDWMRLPRLRDSSIVGFAPRLAGLKTARTLLASSVRATSWFVGTNILTTTCPRLKMADMLA